MAELFEHRQRIPPWGTLARFPLQTASTRWSTLRELLEDTFEKMRPKWARDFLFQPDSLVDAQIMSSPLQKSHAIAMQMTGAFQELEQCAMQNRDNLAVHALLIPAYSVGTISAGYVVECYNGATRPEEVFSRDKRLIRCLRNDLNGSTSCASLDELADEVEIGCTFTESTVNSMRAFLRFDRAAFFQSFNMHTGHVDYVGLQNALRISIIGTSISRCILCSAPLFFSCKCKINFKPAKHPLSFENNALYSLPFLGDFHDLYTISNFEQPTSTSVTSSSTSCTSPALIPTSRIYQAYSSNISGTPFGVAERLHKWAVTTLMCQQKPNPLHLTFPNVPVPSSPFIQRKQSDFPALLTSASSALPAAPELFSNPPEPPDLVDIFEYSNAAVCGNSHHHHHHHNQNNNNQSVSNTNNNNHSNSIVVPIALPSESDTNYFESKMAEAESDELLSETPPSDFATSTVTSELFSHSASSSSPPADIEDPIPTDLSTFPAPPQPAPAPAPTPPEQQPTPTPTPTPTPPPLSSPAILPQLLPQVIALPSLASAAAVTTASAIKQGAAVRHVPKPIAPAPLQCRQQGAGGLINAPLTEGTAYLAKLERDRLARLEARKIRKREAAARSNARRSQRRLEERQKKAAAVSR